MKKSKAFFRDRGGGGEEIRREENAFVSYLAPVELHARNFWDLCIYIFDIIYRGIWDAG